MNADSKAFETRHSEACFLVSIVDTQGYFWILSLGKSAILVFNGAAALARMRLDLLSMLNRRQVGQQDVKGKANNRLGSMEAGENSPVPTTRTAPFKHSASREKTSWSDVTWRRKSNRQSSRDVCEEAVLPHKIKLST